MDTVKIISGNSEQEVWGQIEAELQSDPSLLQYQVEIHQDGKILYLDIDIDLGGGFEGGFELTTISAPIVNPDDFRFALHHEEFLDEIGKFCGMEDLEIGFPEFDEKVVVKSNNPQKIKLLFSDLRIRSVVQSLDVFRLYTEMKDSKCNLVLEIEDGITDHARLRDIYSAFYQILLRIQE